MRPLLSVLLSTVLLLSLSSLTSHAQDDAGGGAEKAPAADGEKAPAGDGAKAPAEDGEKPPAGVGEKAPAGDGDAPPAGDGDAPPAGDGDAPPAGDGDAPPAGDAVGGGGNYVPDLDAEQRGETRPEDKYYKSKQKASKKSIKEFRAQLQADRDDRLRQLTQEREEKITPIKSSTVPVDDHTIPAKEPKSMEEALNLGTKSIRDEYLINPSDFNLYQYERWSLHKADFQFDEPKYVVAEIREGFTKRWFAITYSITNSSTKSRRIAPQFVAVTNKGVFMPAVTGFLPQRFAADSSFHPMAGSKLARDTKWRGANVLPMESAIRMLTADRTKEGYSVPVPPKPMARFLPGQKRFGIALWPAMNDQFTELKIVIHGLNNAHRYDRKQRRVLVLSFDRNDDEFHVNRTRLYYRSKRWEFLWMWDQDITVPIPTDATQHQIKDVVLDTPSGGKQLIWSIPYQIFNSSESRQIIRIKEIRMVLRGQHAAPKWSGFTFDIGGQKVTIREVHVVDDGRSTIYKAQYFRQFNSSKLPQDTDRFAPDVAKSKEPGGMVHTIEKREKGEDPTKLDSRAIFDVSDIDFEHAFQQIESELTLKMNKQGAATATWNELVKRKKWSKKIAGKNPGFLYNPQRFLTYDTVHLKDGRFFSGDVTRADDNVIIIHTKKEGNLEFAKSAVEKVEEGERTKVRKQIIAAIPTALAATKADKKVVMEFICESGLSSGKYRISRTYRQRGVIQKEWLSAWESLDQ